MKQISTLLILLLSVGFSLQSFGQEVGIGTINPQRMLHVGGATNTVRVDGIGTGGSFLTAPSASTDRLLYANATGDVSSIPAGNTGDVMSVNGSGNIAWMAQVGKLVSGTTVYTTAATTQGATVTTYTDVTGLTQTVTVPANTTYLIYATTDGGVYGVPATGTYSIVRVSLFIDGVESADGGKRDALTMNSISGTLANRPSNWSVSKVITFVNSTGSPQNHTIKVMAKGNGTNSGAGNNNTIGGVSGSSNQGSLTLLVFQM